MNAHHLYSTAHQVFATLCGHPYLQGGLILPQGGDPSHFVVVLTPSWADVDAAVDAALREHGAVTENLDLAPYLPAASTLPDWSTPPHVRGVRYVYPFAQIEDDHRTGRLEGDPIWSLLAC